MGLVFTARHQKLVNNCYPRGRTSDMKPNSSETAYLLYYVSSRRSKLEKVCKYLAVKAVHDLRHKKLGYTAVSIALMSKIIESCYENLNIFVNDFTLLLIKILSDPNFNNDLTIVELVEMALNRICGSINNNTLYEEKEILLLLARLIEVYLQVSSVILRSDELLLKGCIDVSIAVPLCKHVCSNHLISVCVDICLKKFQEKYKQFKYVNIDTVNGSSSRVRSTVNINELTDNDLIFQSTKRFFSTTETDKLILSVRQLIFNLQEVPNTAMLYIVCEWIPVQLRYILVMMLLRQLNTQFKIIDENQPIITLKLVSSLLSSNISIIGLSVVDLIRKLLKFQIRFLDMEKLTLQCRKTICDFNFKVYYSLQTSDIILELIHRLNAEENELKRETIKLNIIEVIKTSTTHEISLKVCCALLHEIPNYFISIVNLTQNEIIASSYVYQCLFELYAFIQTSEHSKIFLITMFNRFKINSFIAGIQYFESCSFVDDKNYYLTFHLVASEFFESKPYNELLNKKRKSNSRINIRELVDVLSSEHPELEIVWKILEPMNTESRRSNTSSKDTETLFNNVPHNKKVNSLPVSFKLSNRNSISKTMSSNAGSKKWHNSKAPKIDNLKESLRGNYDYKFCGGIEYSSKKFPSSKLIVTKIPNLLKQLKQSEPGNSRCSDQVIRDQEQMKRLKRRKLREQTPILNLDDRFRDATEQLDQLSARGKLFSA